MKCGGTNTNKNPIQNIVKDIVITVIHYCFKINEIFAISIKVTEKEQ